MQFFLPIYFSITKKYLFELHDFIHKYQNIQKYRKGNLNYNHEMEKKIEKNLFCFLSHLHSDL